MQLAAPICAFITANGDWVNLNCVAAIESMLLPDGSTDVIFHLQTGAVLASRNESCEKANAEKMLAIRKLSGETDSLIRHS